MTTHVDEKIYGKVMEIRMNGTLTKEDYARFVPDTEEMIEQHEKINMLIVIDDFHGWDAGAMWEDIKWDAKHFNHVERIAVVRDQQWQKWMTHFCKPFTTAQVRCFEPGQEVEARAWLND